MESPIVVAGAQIVSLVVVVCWEDEEFVFNAPICTGGWFAWVFIGEGDSSGCRVIKGCGLHAVDAWASFWSLS